MIQLAEPFKTPYDFRFSLFGFPVRVQALFWLTAAMLGYSAAQSFAGEGQPIEPSLVLLVILADFVSIFVHELGHSLMMRRFGIESHIVLYWFGGLAIPGDGEREDSPWGSMSWKPERAQREVTSGQRILISFAGPLAGFVLAAVVVLCIVASGGKFWLEPRFPLFFDFEFAKLDRSNYHLYVLTHVLLWINIFWGLINLLPVFPLDGGQIAREIFVQKNPLHGTRLALMVSMWTAIGAALVGLLVMKDMFVGLLFASLAATSYQALQQIGSPRDPW